MLKEDGVGEQKRGDDGDIVNERQLDQYRKSEEYMTYEALCRGENTHVSRKHHVFVKKETLLQ